MSGSVIATTAATFPQTAGLRTRSQLALEVSRFAGGGNDPERMTLANQHVDQIVRKMNAFPWKFNRVVNDVPLSGDDDEYTLASDFRSPLRALLVDSSSKERDTVTYVPFEEFVVAFAYKASASASMPQYYTVRNVHETGKVQIYPPVNTASLTWPTLRIYYHRRIVLASSESAKLNVPQEVEEAILHDAAALNLMSVEGATGRTVAMTSLARDLYLTVEREYRDYPDY